MIDEFTPHDAEEARAFLDALLEAVSVQENTLSDRKKRGPASEAVYGMKETVVNFGNPYDNLTRLDSKLFDELGIPLSPVQKKQLEGGRFDFFYMTLTVTIQPRRGSTFSQVVCKLNFDPKETAKPIIQTYFPVGQWKELLSLGVGVKLALNGDFNWSAKVDNLTPSQLKRLPTHLRASIVNEGEFKAFITVPNYVYSLGKSEISATGTGDSFCRWDIEKFNIRKEQTITYAVVFKVPRGTRRINLVGWVRFFPNKPWLLDKLRGVYKYLTKEFQTVLQSERDEERLSVGDQREWLLDLPDIADNGK